MSEDYSGVPDWVVADHHMLLELHDRVTRMLVNELKMSKPRQDYLDSLEDRCTLLEARVDELEGETDD